MRMYPDARVPSGGGADEWKSRLPQGFDQSKIPAGANGVTKDGDVYIFTKDGVALQNGKYNADGSLFDGTTGGAAQGGGAAGGGGTPDKAAGNASSGTGTPDVSSQLSGQSKGGASAGGGNNGNGNVSLFGNGFTSSVGGYGDLSSSWASGAFDIDPNRLMQSANMMQNLTNLAGNVPFGLGSFFAQGPLMAVLQSFMNAISFKFDFSNFNFRGTQSTTTTTTTSTTVSSDDSEGGTSNDIPNGYEATDVTGVFKKGNKYYKYDANKNLVECNADGTDKTSTSTTTTTTKTKGNTDKSSDKDKTAAKPKTRKSPDGWYAASNAGNDPIKNITVDNLKEADKNDKSSAVDYVINKLVGLVPGLSAYDRAEIKNAIIKNNKSVFNSDGSLKDGLKDLSKLDIPTVDWIKSNIPTKTQSAANKEAEAMKGYTNVFTYDHLYRSSDNKLYHYDKATGKAIKVDKICADGYYLAGGSMYYRTGTRVLSDMSTKKGNIRILKTENIARGSSSQMLNVQGISYTAKDSDGKNIDNNICEDGSSTKFHISGSEYELVGPGAYKNYGKSMKLSSVTKGGNFAFINNDGSFNPDSYAFKNGCKLELKGKGEFGGCEIKPCVTQNGKKVAVVKNGKYYDLELLMRTGQKFELIVLRSGSGGIATLS